jgi:hypothetical protein
MTELEKHLINSAMQLLQTIHKSVEVFDLPKEFWIHLGMTYQMYNVVRDQLQGQGFELQATPNSEQRENDETDLDSYLENDEKT